MVHLRIFLALAVGGLATLALVQPLERALRAQTADAAVAAFFGAPLIVALLAFAAALLFGRKRAEDGAVTSMSVHLDGRKVGSAVTRHAAVAVQAAAREEGRP